MTLHEIQAEIRKLYPDAGMIMVSHKLMGVNDLYHAIVYEKAEGIADVVIAHTPYAKTPETLIRDMGSRVGWYTKKAIYPEQEERIVS